jgi:hypothetical protein
MVGGNKSEVLEITYKVRGRSSAVVFLQLLSSRERMGGINICFTSQLFKYQITILQSTNGVRHYVIRSGIRASNVTTIRGNHMPTVLVDHAWGKASAHVCASPCNWDGQGETTVPFKHTFV